MRTLDLIKLSTRMFQTRALRTSLTILGVSVGIGTIAFLVSLGYGLQTILLEKITTSESLLSLDVFPPDSENLALSASTLEDLRKIEHVKEVIGISLLPSQLTFGESTTDATANITEPAFFRLSGIQLETGALYGAGDKEHIVISSTLAQLFEWKQAEAIGKKVTLTIIRPETRSIEEKKDSDTEKTTTEPSSEVKPPLKEEQRELTVSAVIQAETPSIYFSPAVLGNEIITKFSQAKVRVENADIMESVRSTILEKGYSVLALSDTVDQANKIFNALQITLAVFGAAALLVSAIGMFNTMTIAFLERTQEIGIMRAVGASRQDIFSLFLAEASLMGFLGGVAGILIGFLGQVIVNFGLNLLANQWGGSHVDLFRTPLWFIVSVIVFSTFVGFLTGMFPGRRASKLNPLEALMYK